MTCGSYINHIRCACISQRQCFAKGAQSEQLHDPCTILKCGKIEGRVGLTNSPTIYHDGYDSTSDESGLARACFA